MAMAIAIAYVPTFHEISFAREHDTVTGLTTEEADLNSGAKGYLDEVTPQYKVMDDDQSVINIEDTADTNIPASPAKISNEHSSEDGEVTNHTDECKIDTLEEASPLIGDCPVTTDLKPLGETEQSEQEVECQSETVSCLENAVNNISEGHQYSESCFIVNNWGENVDSEQRVIEQCGMAEECSISENESKRNAAPQHEIENGEENKTVETLILEDKYHENSQNKYSLNSQAEFITSETVYEGEEGERGPDDNVKIDETKTFDSTPQSSFMFERQEKIPDNFSIQDDDEQELESVKKETELIEVNEVTA